MQICTFQVWNRREDQDLVTQNSSTLSAVLLVLLIFMFPFFLQVSAIEQDIIEVDPDTKEMLKVLVSDCSGITFSSYKSRL